MPLEFFVVSFMKYKGVPQNQRSRIPLNNLDFNAF